MGAHHLRFLLLQDDVVLGKKLGTGGFGTVYKAELKDENGRKTEVIVKKAKEFGEAEVWMNERMVRVPGNHVAEFITAFDSKLKPGMRSNAPLDEAIWLLWHYEGDSTLSGVMEVGRGPAGKQTCHVEHSFIIEHSCSITGTDVFCRLCLAWLCVLCACLQ